jgi:transposase
MLRISRQSYTEEFKREAVKLVEGGIKPAEVARQLGISEQSWVTGVKPKPQGI